LIFYLPAVLGGMSYGFCMIFEIGGSVNIIALSIALLGGAGYILTKIVQRALGRTIEINEKGIMVRSGETTKHLSIEEIKQFDFNLESVKEDNESHYKGHLYIIREGHRNFPILTIAGNSKRYVADDIKTISNHLNELFGLICERSGAPPVAVAEMI